MSNTPESCVSTQDTFRIIETEEKTSSVSALVSRFNICTVQYKNDSKERSSKECDRKENKSVAQIFPWLPKINDLCRSSVGSKNIKTLENLLTVYLQKVTASVKECYLKPIRAGKLKTCMKETLVFFHFLYQDIKESVDNTLYLEKMTELMAMYSDMEIKSAKLRKESTQKVVSRMSSALNIFLDRSENHILDAIMKAKYFTTKDKEICSPVLEKLLTSIRSYNMNDTLYVRYLLVFKLWKKIVADSNQRKEINKLAIARLLPPENFADRFKRFNNVLPRMPNSKNITTFYMQAKLNIRKACQNFMKISKDPLQPVIIDKPLFFEGRTQSTFSGKGNAFDGGVVRNLMNEIWSISTEDNATSNKKTKDSNRSKKKSKKNSPEKKKNRKKSESIGSFSDSNSPINKSRLEERLSAVDVVTSSASVDRGTDASRLNLRDASMVDDQPLPDSSTSRTPMDTATPSCYETKPPLHLITMSPQVNALQQLPAPYDCMVTSGSYLEDRKPILRTLELSISDNVLRTPKGEVISSSVEQNLPDNHMPMCVDKMESIYAATSPGNVKVAVKIEDNQDKCISAVVGRETKSSPMCMYTYMETDVYMDPFASNDVKKPSVPATTDKEDLPEPEKAVPPVLDIVVFKDSDIQLGDQDLPFIDEEVIEPCVSENDTDNLSGEGDKSGVSVIVSSTNSLSIDNHFVTSSQCDGACPISERKPVRKALKDCIPLNVRRDMMAPRPKTPITAPVASSSPQPILPTPYRSVSPVMPVHVPLPVCATSPQHHPHITSTLTTDMPVFQPITLPCIQPNKTPSPRPVVYSPQLSLPPSSPPVSLPSAPSPQPTWFSSPVIPRPTSPSPQLSLPQTIKSPPPQCTPMAFTPSPIEMSSPAQTGFLLPPLQRLPSPTVQRPPLVPEFKTPHVPHLSQLPSKPKIQSPPQPAPLALPEFLPKYFSGSLLDTHPPEMYPSHPSSMANDLFLQPDGYNYYMDSFASPPGDIEYFQHFFNDISSMNNISYAINPNELGGRPTAESGEFSRNLTDTMDPMEMNNAFQNLLDENPKWYTNAMDTDMSMVLMAGDEDPADAGPYSFQNYSTPHMTSEDYQAIGNNAKQANDLNSSNVDISNSQLISTYRNSIFEPSDKTDSSYRMANPLVNSVNNSFPLEDTGTALRKSRGSSKDSLSSCTTGSLSNPLNLDSELSEHLRHERPVPTKSRTSLQQPRNLLGGLEVGNLKQEVICDHLGENKEIRRMWNGSEVRPVTSSNKREDSSNDTLLQATSTLVDCSVQLSPLTEEIRKSKDRCPIVVKSQPPEAPRRNTRASQGSSPTTVRKRPAVSPSSSLSSLNEPNWFKRDVLLGAFGPDTDAEQADVGYSPNKKIKLDGNKRPVTRSIAKETMLTLSSSMPNTSRKQARKLR